MTSPSHSPIAALRASHDRLRAVAEPLTSDQVRQRGYPSEWSIAQVLSHLGSGAEINALILDAGLAGAEPPAREGYPPIWDRWNNKSPDDQAADALIADAALVEKIEANADSPATFAMFFGPSDINGLALGRLSEHAIHTWDVDVAVNPSATVLPEAVPLILSTAGRLVGFAAKPTDWTGTIHVTTTDPAQEFALTLGAPSSLEPWSAGDQADATLELPAEAFLRLLYGRLDPDHTPAVTAEGVGLDDLRAAFPGF